MIYRRKKIWIIGYLLWLAATGFGQTTGKITGIVHDRITGQPLIGVNVVIKGTTLGAATDVQGWYVILNVPPGTQELSFTYIGYKSVTVKDVLVRIDRTTSVEIEMEAVALDLGEVIEVVATRPIVEADKTSSSVHLQADDINRLPIDGVRNLLELAPSVNRNADGTISIRGGSGYEISYSVNGVKSITTNTGATAYGGTNDKGDNAWKYEFNPLAVAQMEVISGGFNAEYGNAQSGVIKVVTKEGGTKFSGGLRIEYRPPGQYHFGDYVYSKRQPEWQSWGTLDPWLTNDHFALDPTKRTGTPFFVNGIPYNLYFYDQTTLAHLPYSIQIDDSAAVNNYNLWLKNHTPGGAVVNLVDGFDWLYLGEGVNASGDTLPLYRKVWQYDRRINGNNILGVYDYRELAYTRYLFSFGGPLGREREKMSFFISGEIKRKPTRLPTREKVQTLQNLAIVLTYKPNPKHNFKLTNTFQYYRSGMGSGSDDIRWAGLSGSTGARRKYTLIYDALREETVTAQSFNHKYIFSSRSFLETALTHQQEVFFSLQIPVPGIDKDMQLVSQGRQPTRLLEDRGDWFKAGEDQYRDYYTWSSLYNQASLTDYYELRANYSAQLTHTNLFKAGLEAWLMDQDYNASSSLTVSSFIWRTGFATNYQAHTKYLAGYLQDKLEFAGMVANLGLRLDAYNFGGKVPVNEYELFYPAEDEGFVPTGLPNGLPFYKKSKTFITASPRVGISFPIAERTAFRVQYGHFRSLPLIRQALDNQTNHGWGVYGNPNLEPNLSINYEVGLQQNLWGTHQFDIVTYYNDLKNQTYAVSVETPAGTIRPNQPDFKGTYVTYRNNSYGTAQGIEISLANKNVSNWRYRCSYALSQTTVGYYGVYLLKEDMTELLVQKYSYSASDYLAYEDRTHRFNGMISYTLPEGSGPRLAGIPICANTTLSLIYRVTSGLPYSWSPDFQTEYRVETNRRYPLESNADLMAEKHFPIGKINFTFSVKVRNLFNNRQLTPFTNSEELTRWVKQSLTYMDAADNPQRNYYVFNYFQTYKNIPREVYLTFGFDF